MLLEEIKAIPGRNIHSHYPVIRMVLRLDHLADQPTTVYPGFNDLILQMLPGLMQHSCSRGHSGGFVERLREGTLLGHVIEHVAIELQDLLGIPSRYGKTRRSLRPGMWEVVFEYQAREGALAAAEMAVEIAEAALENRIVDIAPRLAEIRRLIAATELGPSTQAVCTAAKARGVSVWRLNNDSLVQLGTGCWQHRIQATMTGRTSAIAVDVACDKTITKQVLSACGIPVPYGDIARTEDGAVRIADELGGPVVVKPCDGNQGKGVTLNLTTHEEIRTAFRVAKSYSDRVIVERYVEGRHYRVLVVGDSVIAASERIPAHVVGDGVHTIRELVEQVNMDPRRGEEHEKPLTKIKIDPVSLMLLARLNLTVSYIPAQGERVFLRENANLSTGGTAIDRTDEIHLANCELAIRAARVVGLDIAGIDLVTADITQPMVASGGAVIEVNAAPGIRMHHYPEQGKPRDVGGAIVDYLFPKGVTSEIPIIAVTGTNGKTTTTRLIAHALRSRYRQVGMTCTDGVYIGDLCVERSDATGPRSAQVLLRDPSVEVAVLETARGGIIRSGLGYNLANVAVVTNISNDHIGQDDIADLDELVHVKALVAEAVTPDGTVVLNADDPTRRRLADRARRQIIYFSMHAQNAAIRHHLAAGGKAVFCRGDQVILGQGSDEELLLSIDHIPIALGGKAEHNVANAMAATAALWAFGLSPTEIRCALSNFTPSLEHNPGRQNLFEVDGIQVLVDYGHNEDGYRQTLAMAKRFAPRRLVGVIAVPGDRQNSDVLTLGALAGAGFDRIYVKEDNDLRGRQRGEAADLLRQGCLSGGANPERLETILEEGQAVERAVLEAEAGDMIVIFYEKLDVVLAALDRAQSQRQPDSKAHVGGVVAGR
ncbi:MAG: cyanophycin synthetase [Bacillota bacterium]